MKRSFFYSVCALAIPVTLQSMLQSSFGIIDQIMIGQLSSIHVASVGLACKFTSIFSVVINAIGVVCGIMMAQYIGQNKESCICQSKIEPPYQFKIEPP
ncbi:MATE family efflux transporter, partial [Floccifex sp.]|uniref:MATE family efflux transporter n=1 Tax=Floccifex sp. TaxID=2815810 RepID=UPI003F0652B4